MRHDKRSKPHANSEQKKSIFVLRMIRVIIKNRPFIIKSGLSLFETDAVVFAVGSCLPGIPIESKRIHTYIVRTLSRAGKAPTACLTIKLSGAL